MKEKYFIKKKHVRLFLFTFDFHSHADYVSKIVVTVNCVGYLINVFLKFLKVVIFKYRIYVMQSSDYIRYLIFTCKFL